MLLISVCATCACDSHVSNGLTPFMGPNRLNLLEQMKILRESQEIPETMFASRVRRATFHPLYP